ncbi:hypothetical protein EYF80_030876 [Liparis tanakae]|uniref:Uncharacterized protein n=1 Tax=Liparis tanakae TaxID=230148 RepID=A0A4Z2GZB3_9TELE|nr:hypothetical protein EYF80_030876 [Liparis tanakae]
MSMISFDTSNTAPLCSSSLPVSARVTASLVYRIPFRTSRGAAVTLFSIRGLPLGGEEPVEVCAAGIAGRVLRGEDIGEDVVALAARFVLTHQLGLEEGGPTALQSLHPPHVRLDRQARWVKGHVRRSIGRSIDRSVKTVWYLADSCHPGHFDFGVEVVLFGHLGEEEVDFVVVSGPYTVTYPQDQSSTGEQTHSVKNNGRIVAETQAARDALCVSLALTLPK